MIASHRYSESLHRSLGDIGCTESPYHSIPLHSFPRSLSYGWRVVFPTVDRNLTAVDVRARRMIQPVRVDELAPLAIGGER